MSTETKKRLAQLKSAYESGALDEDTYRATVEALGGQIGSRAVRVGRDAGTIVTGDKNTVIVQQEVLADPEAADPLTLRVAYLGRLLNKAGYLSLAGVDPKAAGDAEARLQLGAVYTALLTAASEQTGKGADRPQGRQSRRLSALEQLNRHGRLVLLGDPGSGKSTFVDFVACCLAGQLLERPDINLDLLTLPLPEDEGDDQGERQHWQHGPLLPVRVILRDFTARGLPPAGEKAGAADLWRFIEAELAAASLQAYGPYLQKELLEKGGLLLLDGLDEVPEADRRRVQIKQVVEDVAATYGKLRILVTSRTYAYQKQDWRLPEFEETLLAPFSQGQIRRFVDRWYTHIAELRGLDSGDAQGRAALLKNAISNSERLRGLAERPLLLTLMASLHAWRGGSLPEKREELYSDAVDLLLDWWESQRVVRDAQGQIVVIQKSLAEYLKLERTKVRGLLNRLAFEAHKSQPELVGTADVPEEKLISGLLALSENPDARPKQLVAYLSQRAGLLLPRAAGVYTFPHRTFQEYLAACYLTDHDYPDEVARLVRDPERWREATLLAGAKAARGAASTIWSLVDALCYEPADPDRLADPACIWGAQMAGLALAESAELAQVSARNQPKVDRVREWLVHLLPSFQLPAVERATAGVSLVQLGDPRPEVMSLAGMQFCYMPAGPFLMGSGDDDPEAQDDEKPLHELTLPAYWIGRYPVSNAQYAVFVEAGGYEDEAFWTEAAAANYWNRHGFKGRYDSEARQAAVNYGSPFNLTNHPAVGVSWYEALAYTSWLTGLWRAAGRLPADWLVTLPSEAQWEKAARGGSDIATEPLIDTTARGLPPAVDLALSANPMPRRVYPWGNDLVDDRINYGPTDIGATSALGVFPKDNSPLGVLGLAGNVNEWTRTTWEQYPYKPGDGREDVTSEGSKVIRGGSWVDQKDWPRCASRYRYRPDYWNFIYWISGRGVPIF